MLTTENTLIFSFQRCHLFYLTGKEDGSDVKTSTPTIQVTDNDTTETMKILPESPPLTLVVTEKPTIDSHQILPETPLTNAPIETQAESTSTTTPTIVIQNDKYISSSSSVCTSENPKQQESNVPVTSPTTQSNAMIAPNAQFKEWSTPNAKHHQ